ncbi:MAG: hypothetical protein ACSHXH_17815 [Marivita sp.]|uniref:hypothetical protein n=1 Tax=Marivita sp. TaxID=2003365 RepID=UPI003EF4446F
MALDLSTLTPEEAITAFYIGYFERAADPEGLEFWTNVLEMTSLDLAAIASNFVDQPETADAHPFFANPTEEGAGAFIAELYLNLFERTEVDAAGLEFWTDVLLASVNGEEGALSVGEIIIQIISGAQDTEAGNDRTTILNKIDVATAFTAAANAEGITSFPEDDPISTQASSIIANVTSEGATVVAAKTAIGEFFSDTGGGGGVAGDFFILSADQEQRDNLSGTEGNDTFEAFNAELQDGDRVDGGAGRDVLTYFNSVDGVAKAPITTGVEQFVITNQMNDLNSVADNNVGGYSSVIGDQLTNNLPIDGTIEVDVEIDGGTMSGITRWEDYDSRADVVIEDARDLNPDDGTFTGDITVAMVSTDPGNVDYAVYFDDPTNTSQNFGTLELRVLDQEAAFGLPAPSAGSTGYLTESSLVEFTFEYDGGPITVTLADQLGVTYGPNVTFQDLLEQIEGATQQALVDAGATDLNFAASFGAPVSVGVGNQFTLPIILTFDVPADTITANPNNIIVQGRDSGNNNATDTFGALATDRQTVEELIRLNVELDDVGKGSMGGDAMFGAMSTGRQDGDDGTSDSIGIQQFDIEVDRSSQLQTIASTNNSLQVVNIVNGENDGPNNTTTAADERIGDLVVRGNANPSEFQNSFPAEDFGAGPLGALITAFSGVATDGPMPGAVPQHNIFGFTDVRVVNASTMVGAVDLTVGLTEEIVEKYLNIQDSGSNGNADDVLFDYDLGRNNDEFFLAMSADGMNSAGTGSREDFRLDINGNAGNDVITTNIGGSDATALATVVGANANGVTKLIDEQGQDYYVMNSTNGEQWYENSVSQGAASFTVSGGAGNDIIWTHGWGDFTINDGAGTDVVYTDNSGATQASAVLATNIDRNLLEHEQIDYVIGDVWAFNAEFVAGSATVPFQVTGVTNEWIDLATLTVPIVPAATSGFVTVSVTFLGASGLATTGYVSTVQIPFSELNINTTTGLVRIREQSYNQAIKAAVNDDPILSNLLEAADGPGQSLIVATKVDGDYIAADLAVNIDSLTINSAPVVLAATANANPGYVAPLFADIGVNALAESDNLINVAGDGANDLFVLSTTEAATVVNAPNTALENPITDLNGASNEILSFSANFGRDTIVNFDEGVLSADGDVLDFTPITGVAANALQGAGSPAQELTALTGQNGQVDIIDLGTVTGIDGLDINTTIDAAEIALLFTADAANATATNNILIVTDTTNADLNDIAATGNIGQVWHIVDGAGTAGVTASMVGEISLIGQDWLALTVDNIA